MIVGDRLRLIREQKNLTQGDIERTCGLKRCYVSRVEHGHTVPSIETLEKWARALSVPVYQVLYDGKNPPQNPPAKKNGTEWGSTGKDAHLLIEFRRMFTKMDEAERQFVLHMSRKMGRESNPPSVRPGRRGRQSA